MNSKFLIYVEELNNINDEGSTYRHTLNVSKICGVICDLLYNGNVELKKLTMNSALIHDLGKLFIDQEVLNKKGKLNSVEFDTMKLHVNKLKEHEVFNSKLYNDEVKIAMMHHEKINGKGYPLGIVNIPLPARILTFADMLEAISSTRVYKRSYTKSEVKEIMINDDGLDLTLRKNFDLIYDAIYK